MWRSVLECCFLLSLTTSALAAEPNPTGLWQRGDGNARVKISRCGADFCATNVWVKDPSSGEAVGDVLKMMVKPTSATMLTGQAFDRKRDLTYSMELSVQPTNMSSRGCIVGGLLCKSVSWTRIR